MPNYDIIPLATDLLDYTIQRVKVKEPQYTKVKAYVMENGQMVEKELFEKTKDDGKPHFPKSQTFHMCADMQRMASAWPAPSSRNATPLMAAILKLSMRNASRTLMRSSSSAIPSTSTST